ncbi:RNA polymerase sigma factor [Bryobacter aggregatus]|uniref:RNA polymerase sigma factor n=1 Tax=Bryobacter aggregatus TaxID=360054 RepID=UPI0004E0B8F0|nr:RNA polymerase sigma factor [Bryobacter aggregatus]
MTAPRPLQAVLIAEPKRAETVPDLRQLYAHLHPRLYRFGLAFSGSESRAAEAIQEAFLDLIRNPGLFNPSRGSAQAFLYGVVRNRLRSSRRNEREEPLEDDNAADGDLLLHLEREQRIHAVRDAILSLPEHYREVVLLCEIEECSYEDAAAALDIAIGTVRSRLSRAKQQLKLRLRQFEGEIR